MTANKMDKRKYSVLGRQKEKMIETFFPAIKMIVFAIVLLLDAEGPLKAQNTAQTEVVYLSGRDRLNTVEWDFFCTEGMNSGKWTKIQVPSNWELQGFGVYNYGHDHRNENKKYGKEQGLYRHSFQVPAEWKGRRVNIVFDGSMTDTEVKINGKPAGPVHQGAFYRFKYDISKLLKYGQENLLEANVAKFSANESVNRAERYADYWIFGGIFRPVYLEALPEYHIERIAVNAVANGSLTANTFVNRPLKNMTLRAGLFTIDGQKRGETMTASVDPRSAYTVIEGSFQNVKTWTPESPNLYTIRIGLYRGEKLLHEKEETIGFRTVELRPNDGIYVNGKKVVLKGVDRHSFWPESGRCLSDKDHLADVELIKGMNMNAVRMSHYPPDERFLGICDSLGLFVLDELGGWQQGYDTVVGPKLIYEMIVRDENHPSVILWDHGNEGGWDFANEKWFHACDFQKRPVIYPWLLRNHIDTRHYPSYNDVINRFRDGNEIFMPTEFLHGLYDGGHGAGLDDYWKAFKENPRYAGGFLWVLRDEAVWRADLKKYDSDGNHAPDGIVGPHGEKEGSYYTIREIWSPVQVKPVVVSKNFDGVLILENEYFYTNLRDCSFSWNILETHVGSSGSRVIASGGAESPDIDPGESGKLNFRLPANFAEGDILSLTANDPLGREIYTWTWMIKTPGEFAREAIANAGNKESRLTVEESGEFLHAVAGDLALTFSIKDGTLVSVKNKGKEVSFNGGPTPAGHDNEIKEVSWRRDNDGSLIIEGSYHEFPQYFKWKLFPSGLLYLEAAPMLRNKNDVEFLGVSFNYPEERCLGVEWLGKGPYRVYKNRLKGTTYNLWRKDYNNTISGESFDNLVYPEFKGYHAGLYWARLKTRESDFTMYCETPGIYLRLFTPDSPADPGRGANVPYPEGDISFLYDIPAIGTKFIKAEDLGPSSQRGQYRHHNGDQFEPIKLWFDFRN